MVPAPATVHRSPRGFVRIPVPRLRRKTTRGPAPTHCNMPHRRMDAVGPTAVNPGCPACFTPCVPCPTTPPHRPRPGWSLGKPLSDDPIQPATPHRFVGGPPSWPSRGSNELPSTETDHRRPTCQPATNQQPAGPRCHGSSEQQWIGRPRPAWLVLGSSTGTIDDIQSGDPHAMTDHRGHLY